FNAPHGACPRCTGLGAQQEIDPDLIVPDPTLSLGDGALVPWSVGNSSFYESVIQAIAERYEISLDAPWHTLTEEQQNYFLYGTGGERVYVQYRNRMGRRRSYMLAFEGIVSSLERRYKETDSSSQRERIEEYMSFRPCPACKGARLKPEVLAVTVGGKSIRTLERLRDLGNTVLVVEHDEQMMREADWLVDMGPGAGEHGGHVVAEGSAKQVSRNKKSITGQFLAGERSIAIPPRREHSNGALIVHGAREKIGRAHV